MVQTRSREQEEFIRINGLSMFRETERLEENESREPENMELDLDKIDKISEISDNSLLAMLRAEPAEQFQHLKNIKQYFDDEVTVMKGSTGKEKVSMNFDRINAVDMDFMIDLNVLGIEWESLDV